MSGGGNLKLIPTNLGVEKDRKICYYVDNIHHIIRGVFMKKRAFTLAEVLITLGIIGIVAALTMPTLIGNYQKKQTVVKLKKVYTTLYQAVELSEEQNGPMDYWDSNISSNDIFIKYIKPYVKNIQSINYYRNKMPLYKGPNGSVEGAMTTLYQNTGLFVLNDGTVFFTPKQIPAVSIALIAVDLNGFRGPNIIGRDWFVFSIPKPKNTKIKVVPYGTYNTADMSMGEWTRENTQKGSYACSKHGRGQYCAALIMIDNWEIKDYYPW